MKLTRAEFLKGAAAAGVLALTPSSPMAQSASLIMRKIPSSGAAVPAIGLGTAQSFGDATDGPEYEARKAVIAALLAGAGTVIDTAPVYSRAETVIGRALSELKLREKTFLSTKVSISGEQPGVDQMAKTFTDLKTNHVELMLVHNLRDTDIHLRTMARMKAEGRIKYVGATTSFEGQHERMVEAMQQHKLDWIQIDYALDNRNAERRILPTARDKGVAVMINLPFGRTRLFSKVRGKALPDWAKDIECTSWAQIFLKFVIAHEGVTVAVPGTNNPEHMKDNLGAMRGRLPDAAMLKRMIAAVEEA
jgi:aryl-alcohol dehydrogenase-like predicted oxidoreductase